MPATDAIKSKQIIGNSNFVNPVFNEDRYKVNTDFSRVTSLLSEVYRGAEDPRDIVNRQLVSDYMADMYGVDSDFVKNNYKTMMSNMVGYDIDTDSFTKVLGQTIASSFSNARAGLTSLAWATGLVNGNWSEDTYQEQLKTYDAKMGQYKSYYRNDYNSSLLAKPILKTAENLPSHASSFVIGTLGALVGGPLGLAGTAGFEIALKTLNGISAGIMEAGGLAQDLMSIRDSEGRGLSRKAVAASTLVYGALAGITEVGFDTQEALAYEDTKKFLGLVRDGNINEKFQKTIKQYFKDRIDKLGETVFGETIEEVVQNLMEHVVRNTVLDNSNNDEFKSLKSSVDVIAKDLFNVAWQTAMTTAIWDSTVGSVLDVGSNTFLNGGAVKENLRVNRVFESSENTEDTHLMKTEDIHGRAEGFNPSKVDTGKKDKNGKAIMKEEKLSPINVFEFNGTYHTASVEDAQRLKYAETKLKSDGQTARYVPVNVVEMPNADTSGTNSAFAQIGYDLDAMYIDKMNSDIVLETSEDVKNAIKTIAEEDVTGITYYDEKVVKDTEGNETVVSNKVSADSAFNKFTASYINEKGEKQFVTVKSKDATPSANLADKTWANVANRLTSKQRARLAQGAKELSANATRSSSTSVETTYENLISKNAEAFHSKEDAEEVKAQTRQVRAEAEASIREKAEKAGIKLSEKQIKTDAMLTSYWMQAYSGISGESVNDYRARFADDFLVIDVDVKSDDSNSNRADGGSTEYAGGFTTIKGKGVIHIDAKWADPVTVSHEMSHAFLTYLDSNTKILDDFKTAFKAHEQWDNVQNVTGSYDDIHSDLFQERFARELEKYIVSGSASEKSFNTLFDKIWDVVKGLGSLLADKNQYEEITEAFDKLFNNSFENKETVKMRNAQQVSRAMNKKKLKRVVDPDSVIPSAIENEINSAKYPIENTEQYKATEKKLLEDPKNFDADGNHLAPNGERSNLSYEQWVTVRTENFKNWFGDWENDPENSSKVVDDNGEPRVVYHATRSLDEFDTFKIGDGSYYGSAIYFSINPRIYENNRTRVIPAFLNIRNMNKVGYENDMTYTIAKMQENVSTSLSKDLYDRKIREINSKFTSEYGIDGFELDYKGWYMALQPNQVKSATSNNGDFSNDDNVIYHSIRAEEIKNDLDSANVVDATLNITDVPDYFLDKSNKFRKQRVDWAYEQIKNKTVDSVIGSVNITKTGINDSLFHGHNKYKASLYPILDSLISNGILANTLEDNGMKNYVLISKFSRDGDVNYVGIVIKEDRHGNKYYNHTIGQKNNWMAKRQSAKQSETPTLHPDISMIIRNILSVNESDTDVERTDGRELNSRRRVDPDPSQDVRNHIEVAGRIKAGGIVSTLELIESMKIDGHDQIIDSEYHARNLLQADRKYQQFIEQNRKAFTGEDGKVDVNGLTTALIEKLNLNKENFDVFKFAVKRELAYEDFGFSDTGDKEFMAQFKKGTDGWKKAVESICLDINRIVNETTLLEDYDDTPHVGITYLAELGEQLKSKQKKNKDFHLSDNQYDEAHAAIWNYKDIIRGALASEVLDSESEFYSNIVSSITETGIEEIDANRKEEIDALNNVLTNNRLKRYHSIIRAGALTLGNIDEIVSMATEGLSLDEARKKQLKNQAKIMSLSSKDAKNRDEIADLKKQLADRGTKYSEARNQNVHLEAENKKLERENKVLKKQVDETVADKNDLLMKLGKRREESILNRAEIQRLSQENDDLSAYKLNMIKEQALAKFKRYTADTVRKGGVDGFYAESLKRLYDIMSRTQDELEKLRANAYFHNFMELYNPDATEEFDNYEDVFSGLKTMLEKFGVLDENGDFLKGVYGLTLDQMKELTKEVKAIAESGKYENKKRKRERANNIQNKFTRILKGSKMELSSEYQKMVDDSVAEFEKNRRELVKDKFNANDLEDIRKKREELEDKFRMQMVYDEFDKEMGTRRAGSYEYEASRNYNDKAMAKLLNSSIYLNTTNMSSILKRVLSKDFYDVIFGGNGKDYGMNDVRNNEITATRNRLDALLDMIQDTIGVKKLTGADLKRVFVNGYHTAIGYDAKSETKAGNIVREFFESKLKDETVKTTDDAGNELAADGKYGKSDFNYNLNELMAVYIYAHNKDTIRYMSNSIHNLNAGNMNWVLNRFDEAEKKSINGETLTTEDEAYLIGKKVADYILKDAKSRFAETKDVYHRVTGKSLRELENYFGISFVDYGINDSLGLELEEINYSKNRVKPSDKITKEREHGSKNVLDFNILSTYERSVKAQEHYIASADYFDQMNDLFNGKTTGIGIREIITERYGERTADAIFKWLKIQASPTSMYDDVTAMLAHTRANMIQASLAFNPTTILKQLSAPALLAQRGFGAVKQFLPEMQDYLRDRKGYIERVNRISPQMRDRTRREIQFVRNVKTGGVTGEFSNLSERQQKAKTVVGEKYDWVMEKGMSWMENVDEAVADIMFMCAFKQNLANAGISMDSIWNTSENGETTLNEEAYKHMNEATQWILDTQPSSNAKDTPLVFSLQDNLVKSLLMFQNQSMKMFGMISGSAIDLAMDMTATTWLNFLKSSTAVVLATALSAAIGGYALPDDDDEYALSNFMEGLALEMSSTIPIFGDSLNDAIRGYSNDDKFYWSQPITRLVELVNAFKVKEGKEIDYKRVSMKAEKLFSSTVGAWVGGPQTVIDKFANMIYHKNGWYALGANWGNFFEEDD